MATSLLPLASSGTATTTTVLNSQTAAQSCLRQVPDQGSDPSQTGVKQVRIAHSGDVDDDDDDDDEDFDDYDLNPIPASARRGRGFSRALREMPKQSRHPGSEEEDRSDDEYAMNRERLETRCKYLSVKQFSVEDKNQDFDIWISQFEDAVNRGLNPHSKRRHYRYCMHWLPGYLNADAYIIWKRHKQCQDWVELKKILRQEYEDPTIRVNWKANPKAYVWDEQKESLTTYCSKVKRYVDTFDTDIAQIPEAVQNQYYIRFFNGLPPDYQDQVRMGTTSKKQNVDRALDICIRYQAVKSGKSKKLEVGASVTFQDATVPSRVTSCETDIIRLKNRLEKMQQEQGQSPSRNHNYRNHRSPSYNRNQSPRDTSRESGMSSDSSLNRQQDRMNRFQNWRRGNYQRQNIRAKSPHSFNRLRNQQQGNYNYNQNSKYDKQNNQNNQNNNVQNVSQAASLDTGFPLESEAESDADDLDDTICEFAAFAQEQQEKAFREFCEKKDKGTLPTVPGNF